MTSSHTIIGCLYFTGLREEVMADFSMGEPRVIQWAMQKILGIDSLGTLPRPRVIQWRFQGLLEVVFGSWVPRIHDVSVCEKNKQIEINVKVEALFCTALIKSYAENLKNYTVRL
jgi:hypothetical protein